MFALAFAIVLSLDQLSKSVIVGALPLGHVIPRGRWVPVRIRSLRNRRALLAARSPRLVMFVWILTATGLAVVAAISQDDVATHVALGAALGGATGNVVDLVRRGAVVDFVDLRIWPVFNFADVAIVAGALVALWRIA